MLRAIDKDISTPNVADIMKLVLMIGDIRLLEEREGVAGDVYVFDASVATPAHFAKFTPAIVKKFLICVQVCQYMKISVTFNTNSHNFCAGSIPCKAKGSAYHQCVTAGRHNH